MILRRKIESIETLANDVLLLIMMCLENAIDGTNIKMNEWGWMMQFRFLISQLRRLCLLLYDVGRRTTCVDVKSEAR